MILDIPTRKLIAQERRDFRKVLSHYLPNYPNCKGVLDICCGLVIEEPLIYELFGNDIELISLDHRPHLGLLAEKIGIKTFREGDVGNLGEYVQGKFDLVIGRNVPLNPRKGRFDTAVKDSWPGVFDNLLNFMNPGACLFLTLVREDEYWRAKDILENGGYKLLSGERNPFYVTASSGVMMDQKDQYVVVAQQDSQLGLF